MESETCPWCGGLIEQKPGPGRPPVYCSTRCRRYAYEQRRAAEREGQPVHVVVKQSPPYVIERTRQAWSRPDPNALAEALEEYPDLAASVLRRMVDLAINDRLSERARAALGTYLVRFTGELFSARFAFSQRPATSATRAITAEQWGYLAASTDRITSAERALDARTRALDRREERLQQRQTELDRRAEDIAQRYEQAREHEE